MTARKKKNTRDDMHHFVFVVLDKMKMSVNHREKKNKYSLQRAAFHSRHDHPQHLPQSVIGILHLLQRLVTLGGAIWRRSLRAASPSPL